MVVPACVGSLSQCGPPILRVVCMKDIVALPTTGTGLPHLHDDWTSRIIKSPPAVMIADLNS